MEGQILAAMANPAAHPAIGDMRRLVRTARVAAIMLECLQPFGKMLAHRALSSWELENVLMQLAGSLCFLQQKNIIHRDVKPQNILCGPRQYKLADFGDALMLPMHGTISLAGSLKYWPPEGPKVFDVRRSL